MLKLREFGSDEARVTNSARGSESHLPANGASGTNRSQSLVGTAEVEEETSSREGEGGESNDGGEPGPGLKAWTLAQVSCIQRLWLRSSFLDAATRARGAKGTNGGPKP